VAGNWCTRRIGLYLSAYLGTRPSSEAPWLVRPPDSTRGHGWSPHQPRRSPRAETERVVKGVSAYLACSSLTRPSAMPRCDGVTQAVHPSGARERLLGLGNDLLLLRLARDSCSLQPDRAEAQSVRRVLGHWRTRSREKTAAGCHCVANDLKPAIDAHRRLMARRSCSVMLFIAG
jgi:hypothetical protein